MRVIKRSIAFFALCLTLFPLSVLAQSDNYITPDSWSQHQTVNGFKFTMDSTDVGIGNLKVGLTSRYTGRFSDLSDQYFYQYLRAYLSDVKIGNGYLRVAANVRAATDMNGYDKDIRKYRFYPTMLDAQLMNNDEATWDFRIYDASVVLDNVINYTKISGGRIRIDHLSDWKIDGGEILAGTNSINGYVFYGIPVSYYEWLSEQTVGGGINTSFLKDALKVRGEVVYFMDDSADDADTLTWKLRADYNFMMNDLLDANFYGNVGMVEKALIYEAGVFGDIMSSHTSLNLWFKGQSNKNEDPISPIVSDYDYVIGTESEYFQYGINAFQGLGKYFALGLGFEQRFNSDEWYGDRNYSRFMGNVDFFGVIPNNYISVTADYYIVPKYLHQDTEAKLFFGGRITQNVIQSVALWAGAGFTNYKYNSHPINLVNPTPVNFDDEKESNDVYTVYVGGRWDIIENVMLQADYMYEKSDVIGSVDPKNDEIHYAQLWLNVRF